MAGSFHFVILPRKMPASASGVNFRSAVTPGMLYVGTVGAQHCGEVQNLEPGLT